MAVAFMAPVGPLSHVATSTGTLAPLAVASTESRSIFVARSRSQCSAVGALLPSRSAIAALVFLVPRRNRGRAAKARNVAVLAGGCEARRKSLFVGCNWKGAIQDLGAVKKLVQDVNNKWDKEAFGDVELCLFPPYVFIDAVRRELDPDFVVGSQNVWEAKDSLALNTGSVSAQMLAGVGCKWVLLGHADRRHTLGETDELIGAKVKECLAAGLCVNLTIGDTAEVRDAGGAIECLVNQLSVAVAGIPTDSWDKICVAYEPVWAVGEGAQPCSPEEAQRVLQMLRSWISANVGEAAGKAVRMVYTGSVNEANANAYAVLPDNDGFVVGRAGLDADKLLTVCSTLAKSKAHETA